MERQYDFGPSLRDFVLRFAMLICLNNCSIQVGQMSCYLALKMQLNLAALINETSNYKRRGYKHVTSHLCSPVFHIWNICHKLRLPIPTIVTTAG